MRLRPGGGRTVGNPVPEAPAWPGLVLNIGGQGEIAYAIDINNLISPTVDPELFIHSGRFIRADATALPVRSSVADAVKGNRFPAGDETFRLAVSTHLKRTGRNALLNGSLETRRHSGFASLLPMVASILNESPAPAAPERKERCDATTAARAAS